LRTIATSRPRLKVSATVRTEEVLGDQRVGDDVDEVAKADVDLPALRQVVALVVDEEAVGVVRRPCLAGLLVLDAVAARVVGPLGSALEGARQAGVDDRPPVGRHAEVGQILLARPGLAEAEDRVAGRLGDVALGRELYVARGELLETLGRADEGLLGLGIGEQEDDVTGGRVALGGNREPVVGRAWHLRDRGALDGADRVLLAAPVGVAEVREGGAHGVEHGEDLERQQEQRPGYQVLGRDAARGEVDPEQQRGHTDQQGQAEPLALLDQGERPEDRDGKHQPQQHDLDDEAGGRRGARPCSPAGGLGAGARGGAGFDRGLGSTGHVGLPALRGWAPAGPAET
jgi:hypothetical protein